MNRISLGIACVCFLVLGSMGSAAIIRFDQPEYVVSGPGESFLVSLFIDWDDSTAAFDPHVNGLFSFGISVDYPSASAGVSSTANITPDPALDYFGFSTPALKEVLPGAARVKGNIDPSNPIPYFGTLLATFEITNNAPALSTYTLDLDEWRTLGPTEQIFIDGLGNVLDTSAGGMLSFGSAQVQVVPEPSNIIVGILGSLLMMLRRSG